MFMRSPRSCSIVPGSAFLVCHVGNSDVSSDLYCLMIIRVHNLLHFLPIVLVPVFRWFITVFESVMPVTYLEPGHHRLSYTIQRIFMYSVTDFPTHDLQVVMFSIMYMGHACQDMNKQTQAQSNVTVFSSRPDLFLKLLHIKFVDIV